MQGKRLPTIFALALISIHYYSPANSASNFREAKKLAYSAHQDAGIAKTFYCDCAFSRKKVSHQECGYKVRPGKNRSIPSRESAARAARTEVEHVVPAYWMAKGRACYAEAKQYGANYRDHCSDADPDFRRAYTDLVGLRVAIGQINQDRSNFHFTELRNDRFDAYGACDMPIDFKRRFAEPPASRKGDVARIYLYFQHQYGVHLAQAQKSLYATWDRIDPVSDEECLLNNEIKRQQGWGNPLLEQSCHSK